MASVNKVIIVGNLGRDPEIRYMPSGDAIANIAVATSYKSKDKNCAARHVNGTGYHQITGWVPDQRLTMKVNPAWWDKNASNVTEVVYTPIKSDPTRAAALLAGDIDMLTDLPTQDVAKLRQDSKIKIVDGPEVRTVFMAFDQGSDALKYPGLKGKKPFKDKQVREALRLAVDRKAIRRNILRGLAIPAAIMVAPGVNGNSPDIDVAAKPDPERAKKLLAGAGYPNGFEFQLNCPNSRYLSDEKICPALLSMWAKVGIRNKLLTEPMARHSLKFQNFDASAYMLGWSVATCAAQYTLQSPIRTETSGADGNFNFNKVSDAKLDTLIDAMKTETDVAKRNAMIRDALVRNRDESLLLPLHHPMQPWAMKAGVTTRCTAQMTGHKPALPW